MESSLQATWIRNAILRAVRKRDSRMAQGIPIDIVYRNPTVSSLSSSILRVIQGTGDVESGDTTAKREELQNLVEKYTAEFPEFTPSSHAREEPALGKKVVLITGSTGYFGANILARLLTSDTVDEVIVIVRKNASGDTALQRQTSAFSRAGLDVQLLETKPVQLLEGDLSVDGFGLPADKLAKVNELCTCTCVAFDECRRIAASFRNTYYS